MKIPKYCCLISTSSRNVTLEMVKFTDPCGNRKKFDQFFVQQRLIRCVQIPTTIDIREALKKSVLPKKKRGEHIGLSKNRQHILKKRNERRLEDNLNATTNINEKPKS